MLKIKELEKINESFAKKENLKIENFKRLGKLGEGSFGKVFKVSSLSTNLIYALKVIDLKKI